MLRNQTASRPSRNEQVVPRPTTAPTIRRVAGEDPYGAMTIDQLSYGQLVAHSALVHAPPKPVHHQPPVLKENIRPASARTPQRKVKRANNDFCCLSAEISREVAFSSRRKANPNTPSGFGKPLKTPNTKRKSKSIMTPLSKDLFRAKTAGRDLPPVPGTDSKLMQIRLTETASMSSSDTGDGSSQVDLFSTFSAAKQTKRDLGLSKSAKKTRKNSSSLNFSLSARKKLKRCLTPPRNALGSHKSRFGDSSTRSSSAALAALSTSYDGLSQFRLTSTEHDPSPFQEELPEKNHVLVHAKVCNLMDGYTAVHRDFDFSTLTGIGRSTLEKEYMNTTLERPLIAGSCHRNVVRMLLDCAPDLVVEGFFREYSKDDSGAGERMEACIFSSESLRQIIVCFRGSTKNQAKPLQSQFFFASKLGTCRALPNVDCLPDQTNKRQFKGTAPLDKKEQDVPILDLFRSAYFSTTLEKTVFVLLANLASRKPFFDIMFTGHSFGASIAQIASVRYATAKAQMRVKCTVFGSPRIGGQEWRHLVHSLPNLCIYRIENGADPFVEQPQGAEWKHCGHSIKICESNSGVGVAFRALRFGVEPAESAEKSMIAPQNILRAVQSKVVIPTCSSQHRGDHEMENVVEKLVRSGDKWIADFVGMRGNGVLSVGNERRMLS